ncbi:unnamed protein product [Closterium sp. NIES-64]|nr:unnamed protein product [Closterium sp. NIES-64]
MARVVMGVLAALPMQVKVDVVFRVVQWGSSHFDLPTFEGFVGTKPKRLPLLLLVSLAIYEDLVLDCRSGWRDMPHCAALLQVIERRERAAAPVWDWPPTQPCVDALMAPLMLLAHQSDAATCHRLLPSLLRLVLLLLLLLYLIHHSHTRAANSSLTVRRKGGKAVGADVAPADVAMPDGRQLAGIRQQLEEARAVLQPHWERGEELWRDYDSNSTCAGVCVEKQKNHGSWMDGCH